MGSPRATSRAYITLPRQISRLKGRVLVWKAKMGPKAMPVSSLTAPGMQEINQFLVWPSEQCRLDLERARMQVEELRAASLAPNGVPWRHVAGVYSANIQMVTTRLVFADRTAQTLREQLALTERMMEQERQTVMDLSEQLRDAYFERNEAVRMLEEANPNPEAPDDMDPPEKILQEGDRVLVRNTYPDEAFHRVFGRVVRVNPDTSDDDDSSIQVRFRAPIPTTGGRIVSKVFLRSALIMMMPFGAGRGETRTFQPTVTPAGLQTFYPQQQRHYHQI